MAPLFFLLGAVIRKYRKTAEKISIWMLLCGILLMTLEATILRDIGVMRHDSMYISLPLVMFFLFLLLLKKEGREFKSFRTISMAVYIIHPLVIIAVRGISKPLKLTEYTVNNSLIHFLVVAAGSFLAGIVYYLAANKLTKERGRTHVVYENNK